MQKLFAVFCIALALSTVSAQTCASTASLRAAYGLSNSMVTAATASGVNYCKSIKSSAVCCTAAQMNNFQTMSDGVVTAFTNSVAAKDVAVAAIGGSNGQSALTTATANLNTAISNLLAPTAGALSADMVAQMTALFQVTINAGLGFDPANLTASLATTFGNISATLTQLQQYRSTCAVELVKTQASAWCLSCDPTAETKGYNATANTLTMSNDVCARLQTACYNYIANSNLQNVALQVGPIANYIQGAANLMSSVTSATAATAFTAFNATSYYTAAPQVQSGSLPSGCTSATNCDWICTSLFQNGNISSANFVGGGTPVSRPTSVGGSLTNVGVAPTGSLLTGYLASLGLANLNLGNITGDRRLDELTVVVAKADTLEMSGLRPHRSLYNAGTTNTFDPSDDEAGTTVTFTNDPANVNTASKGAVRYYGSVVAVMVIAVCSMML